MCRLVRYLVTLAMLVAAVGPVAAQGDPGDEGVQGRQPQRIQRPLQLQRPATFDLEMLTPLRLSNEFEKALKQRGVEPQKQQAALKKFQSLPDGLQETLVIALNEDYARLAHHEDLLITNIRAEILERIGAERLFFMISSIWPEQGSPGSWAFAFGHGFSDDCTVYFDGSPVPSNYLDMSFEFFPNSMAFQVPAGAARAQEHDVFVRNGDGDNTSVVKYEIVAPRRYRGYHGWKFSNFSRPSIDWKLYADYFGRLNVEYPNGTHRPSAQQWFDDAYTRAGAGGNCYGMSVSSLRVRNHEFDHVFHAAFFQNPATAQSHVWFYDWNDTTRETVQQQQGAWYTQEVLDTHGALWNSQDARDVFTRCEQLTGQVVNRPVLIVWGDGWGHAIVPYDTEVDGNMRRMLTYDNNRPYREAETGDPDPSVATVNWNANTFNYSGGTKGVLMSYDECTPPNPHLPGAEYGGPGSDSAIAVFSPNTNVQQITDEDGRRFFNPDGSVNMDPATRIPGAVPLYPLVQRPPLVIGQQPRLQLQAQAPPLRAPDDAPVMFLFDEPQGKSLTFQIAGDGVKEATFYQRGRIFEVRAAGIGQLQLNEIHQRPSIQIPNPAQLQPQSATLMRSLTAGDRLFELTGFQNLDTQPLRLIPQADGSSLDVQGAPNLQFNLQLLGPVGQGMQGASFGNIALQAGGASRLAPTNWNALQTTQLNLRLINPQNNQILQQRNLPPIR